MKKEYFHFQKFSLLQKKEVMKVGTDGLLLGAFASLVKAGYILDIGTGSGIIALMVAQKQPDARITAMDISQKSFLLASENIKNSPFAERIETVHADFKLYAKNTSQKFDHIICNPPFFRNSLLPKTKGLQTAKHSISLSYSELTEAAVKLLNTNTLLSVVIPFDDENLFIDTARKVNFFPRKICRVRPVPHKPYARSLISFGLNQTNIHESEIVIESGGRHVYSDEYKNLTQDFLLARNFK